MSEHCLLRFCHAPVRIGASFEEELPGDLPRVPEEGERVHALVTALSANGASLVLHVWSGLQYEV